MGKLVVTEFVTLDGVGQAPGAPDEDPEGGFAHGGWQEPLADDESGDVMFEQARSMDALLLGRKTYEIFAGYWPTAPEAVVRLRGSTDVRNHGRVNPSVGHAVLGECR